MSDAGYTDDLMLLTNEPAQVESLLHIPDQAAVGICLFANADETEFTCCS